MTTGSIRSEWKHAKIISVCKYGKIDEANNYKFGFKTNKMSINVEKKNYILFKPNNTDKENTNIQIKIEDSKFTKIHGVIIDNKLNWIEHSSTKGHVQHTTL